jgi:hypothetical protein
VPAAAEVLHQLPSGAAREDGQLVSRRGSA